MASTKATTAFEVESIPDEMTKARRWVNWRAVERDGRWTKVPVNPSTLSNASSTDPATWGSFVDAVDQATADPELGIGFMLGDGWLGIDFDNIDKPEAKQLREWIWDWGNFCGTYLEWSPSKTGIHAIFRGCRLPEWSANRRGPVEVYEKSRFFTVTGNRVYEGRDVLDSQNAVEEVCERWLKKEAPKPAEATRTPATPAGDPSAADWAFCCDLAARGFREAEIAARLVEKMEAEGRAEKAARGDYIQRTVRGALAAAPASEGKSEPLPAISLTALLEEHQNRTPYLIEGILREGEVACLIAPPKCAKSFLLADLALSCACGNRWHGHWPVKEGRVCVVDNELTRNEIAHRMREVMRAKGVTVPRIDGRVDVIALRESQMSAHDVLEQLEGLGKYDLVIFDALYRFLEKGMDENSNADMTVLLRGFSRYAARTGAGVILVHHTSKGNQSGREAIDQGSGAGSIGRAVDTHIVLQRHEQDDVFVETMSTRSSKRPGKLAIRWEYPTFSDVDSTGFDFEALHGAPKPKKKATE